MLNLLKALSKKEISKNSSSYNKKFSTSLKKKQFKYLKATHLCHLVNPSLWLLLAVFGAFMLTSGSVMKTFTMSEPLDMFIIFEGIKETLEQVFQIYPGSIRVEVSVDLYHQDGSGFVEKVFIEDALFSSDYKHIDILFFLGKVSERILFIELAYNGAKINNINVVYFLS